MGLASGTVLLVVVDVLVVVLVVVVMLVLLGVVVADCGLGVRGVAEVVLGVVVVVAVVVAVKGFFLSSVEGVLTSRGFLVADGGACAAAVAVVLAGDGAATVGFVGDVVALAEVFLSAVAAEVGRESVGFLGVVFDVAAVVAVSDFLVVAAFPFVVLVSLVTFVVVVVVVVLPPAFAEVFFTVVVVLVVAAAAAAAATATPAAVAAAASAAVLLGSSFGAAGGSSTEEAGSSGFSGEAVAVSTIWTSSTVPATSFGLCTSCGGACWESTLDSDSFAAKSGPTLSTEDSPNSSCAVTSNC